MLTEASHGSKFLTDTSSGVSRPILTDKAKSFIKECVTLSPESRPTVPKLLSHAWIVDSSRWSI